jgi:hypothetical protein
VPTFNHSTPTQLAQRIRERFKDATRIEALQIARFLSPLTDAQLKALFSLTTPQTATLRAKLTDMMATVDRIRAAVGQ